MRTLVATAVTACLTLLLSACNKPEKEAECPPPPPAERDINIAEVKFFNDSAIDNAIITQHTLYPYHFIPNSAALNELGDHDFTILVDHFRKNPGTLNVRRGRGDAQPLYDARVRLITDRMLQSGVNLGPLADGQPGGDGLPSEHTLNILLEGYEYNGSAKDSAQSEVNSGSGSARSQAIGGTKK
jgi:hypothetical protein